MKYNCLEVTAQGGPEMLKVVEKELREPKKGEVRIKVLASPVCGPDIQARYGQTPIAPRTPFVPGYAVIGTIEAIGPRKSSQKAAFKTGEHVAALTVFGSYSEYIYLKEDLLIPIPQNVDPAAAAAIILNYIVAYQTIHRSAIAKAGDKVLIIGASGGVGMALLELGQLTGLKMYAIASKSKHQALEQYGAIPIDYHTEDYLEVIRKAEPEGLDVVFDGMVWGYIEKGFDLLAPGGTWVQFGNPLSFTGLLKLLWKLFWLNILPNGRSMKLYGTTTSKFGRQNYLDDWAELFRLLEAGKIKPFIQEKFPILDARRANEILESGQVIGNLVLVSPELIANK